MEIKKEFPDITFLEKEPMSRHTTFRIGGPADYFVSPKVNEVESLVGFCRNYGIPYTIMGNGSNVLVADDGIEGLVISLGKEASGINIEGSILTAEAGTLLSQVANRACEAGLGGLSFAAGIPGTVGGGVCMNAGAYGGEMKDILQEVEVLLPDGTKEIWQREEMELSYRSSRMMHTGAIVLKAVMELYPEPQEEIRAKMEDFRKRRQEKQPLEYPSAGSTFKRPEGYFAGKLVMDAGLAGYRVGDAMVSDKHCGFVVNAGSATASQVHRLMEDVRDQVREKFGVELEPEVRKIGRW